MPREVTFETHGYAVIRKSTGEILVKSNRFPIRVHDKITKTIATLDDKAVGEGWETPHLKLVEWKIHDPTGHPGKGFNYFDEDPRFNGRHVVTTRRYRVKPPIEIPFDLVIKRIRSTPNGKDTIKQWYAEHPDEVLELTSRGKVWEDHSGIRARLGMLGLDPNEILSRDGNPDEEPL